MIYIYKFILCRYKFIYIKPLNFHIVGTQISEKLHWLQQKYFCYENTKGMCKYKKNIYIIKIKNKNKCKMNESAKSLCCHITLLPHIPPFSAPK